MKNKLAEELVMAHEGLRANDWRTNRKPGGHELPLRTLHNKDQNQNVILGFGTSFMWHLKVNTKPNH